MTHALDILEESPDWIVISKPAGLAIIPGRGEAAGETVLEKLGSQLNLRTSGSADPRLRVVHRLDKETSGVVLFAKHIGAQRNLSHQFQNNTTAKEYLALVVGTPPDEQGEIDAALDRHPADPKRMAVVRHGGRPARTLWKVERRFRGLTLLRVFPKTGKTHQIRVHLKHAGLPLAIDPLYASGEGIFLSRFKRGYRATTGQPERPLIDRLTLHAEVLGFLTPDGLPARVICPPPKDLRATIAQLSRWARR